MKINLTTAGFWVLMLLNLPLSAQQTQQHCNIVPNPEFNPTMPPYYWGHIDPFAKNMVPGWDFTHMDPMLTDEGPTNPTGSGTADPAALMWSQNWVNGVTGAHHFNGEGIAASIPALTANKLYVFSVMARNEINTLPVDHFYVRLLYNKSQIPYTRGDIPTVPASPGSEMILDVPVTSNSYTQFTRCFTPTNPWTYLWMYPQSDMVLPPNNPAWIAFDDVEIIPLFDFSGPDQTLCSPGCVDIGLPDNCTYINLTPTYEWRELGNPAVIGNTAVLHVCLSATTTYTVTKTIGGCSATEDVTVEVLFGPPVITPPVDIHACYGVNKIIPSPCPQGTTTTKWFEGNAIIQTGGSLTINTTVSKTYVARCFDNATNCMLQETQYNVSVSPDPTPQQFSEHICEGSTVDLNSYVTNPSTCSWYTMGPSGNHVSSASVVTPSTTTIYYSDCVDANGCHTYNEVEVEVSPATKPAITVPMCYGQTLTFSTYGGLSCSWEESSTHTPVGTSIVPPVGNTTYTGYCTDASGCPFTQDIIAQVSAPNTGSVNITKCQGVLDLSVYNSGNTCTWREQPANTIVTPPFIPTVGTHTYRATCTDADGCISYQDVTATIQAPYTVPGVAVQLCTGAMLNLSSYTNGTGCTWVNLQDNSDASMPFSPPVGSHSFRGTCTDANGCIYTTDVTVDVLPPYVVPGSAVVLCEGAILNLSLYSNGNECTWVDQQTQTVVSATFVPSSGFHSYRGTCVDANGCIYTTDITVDIISPVTTTGDLCINVGDNPGFVLPFNCPPGTTPEWTKDGAPHFPIGDIDGAGTFEMNCIGGNGCSVRKATFNVTQQAGCSTQVLCSDNTSTITPACSPFTVEKDGAPYPSTSTSFTPNGTSGSYVVKCYVNGVLNSTSVYYFHKCDGSGDFLWNPANINDDVAAPFKTHISIFPNPTSGKYQVSVKPAKDDQYAIRILDMMGREAFRCENPTTEAVNIDMTAEPKGMYQVLIFMNGEVHTQSIVIQ